MGRRVLDQYFTDESAVRELVKEVDWWQHDDMGLIFCPCAGDGAIGKALQKYGVTNPIVTNDIDPKMPTMAHMDAKKDNVWRFLESSSFGPPLYTVDNPPFSDAPEIVWKALHYTQEAVMMLLRITFLEGCENRKWLTQRPPTRLISLPRYSFTGDGGMDTANAAWFIWDQSTRESSIKVVSKFA